MTRPATPPSSRFTESAVEMAPRLQPKVSAKTGKNTPKAASGVETPNVTVNSAVTINHRRAAGRTLRLLSQLLQGHGPDRRRASSTGDRRSGSSPASAGRRYFTDTKRNQALGAAAR